MNQQHSPSLFFIDNANSVIIFDLRGESLLTYALTPDQSQILMLCNEIKATALLTKRSGFDVEKIDAILDLLDDKKLIVSRYGKNLSLVFDLSKYKPPNKVLKRFYTEMDKVGIKEGENTVIKMQSTGT
jgi:hypothetical protein